MKHFLKACLIGTLLVGSLLLPGSVYAEGEGDGGGTNNGSNGTTSNISFKLAAQEASAKGSQYDDGDPRKRFSEQDDKNQYVDASGAFQYQYPINLPPGTNNLAPELTFYYNSNLSNGMLGMGWTLNGIPEIKRDFTFGVNYTGSFHLQWTTSSQRE